MSTLKDRVAIVTGGSRGIGAAIAKRLAHDGAKVVLGFAKSRDAAEAVAAAIRKGGGQVLLVQGDVAEPAARRRLVEQTLKELGRIDILVNNAGVVERHPLSEIAEEHYARIFDVNVKAPLLLSALVERHLGHGGRIIYISSGASTTAMPGGSIYSASKAAVEAFARVHAVELGERGVTVNAVAPGATETDMLKAGLSEERLQQFLARTPLHRLGKPEDIADVVAFLASDDARWITGQVIGASGGAIMR